MKQIWFIMAMVMALAGNSCSQQKSRSEDSTAVATETDAPDYSASHGRITLEEALSNGRATVIDFYADWCGPCKMISPVFHQLSEKFGDKLNFVSVDVDANPEIAQSYAVEAMPTFVFLSESGEEINRIVGADSDALTTAVVELADN